MGYVTCRNVISLSISDYPGEDGLQRLQTADNFVFCSYCYVLFCAQYKQLVFV